MSKERWPTIYKKCFTCSVEISCDTRPITVAWIGGTSEVVPKFAAPLICKTCQGDAKKFAAVRRAFLKYMRWTEPKPSAVPLIEL